ncbi:TIGR03564 family F420-dependent LLM class oxidoreductase [Streptomyces sp. NPDC048172]|uniref:TIGR03564 family F420-dependent LLM class oxidoreductase n=1 Tax=Streptomyces sp. NPDC048172 TaxID=3365505 RepID=UPI0037184FC1
MTWGVVLNPPASGNLVDDVVAQARQAVEAGVRSAWLGQLFSHDSVALAGLVGREVPGLHVGTSAVPVFARHPLLVAGQAQTSQAATHGRYHLGLGLGAKDLVEGAFGVPYERPIAVLREFLTALRTLLETGTADFHGELLTAAPPLPVSVPGADPTVPVLVAAMGPQALRATGELADGALPFLAGPRTLGEHIVPTLTAAAERAGHPAPRVVALVPAVVTSGAGVEAAREAAATQTAFYDRIPSYQRVIALEGASKAAELVVVGDEEKVAAEARRYAEAGATEIVFTQTDLTGDEARLRTWRLAGELAAGA